MLNQRVKEFLKSVKGTTYCSIVGQATLVCSQLTPDAGGKLSVTAVRYQITDTGSSLEGDGRKGVCYQLVAASCCN